jgi:hypothetical protein
VRHAKQKTTGGGSSSTREDVPSYPSREISMVCGAFWAMFFGPFSAQVQHNAPKLTGRTLAKIEYERRGRKDAKIAEKTTE